MVLQRGQDLSKIGRTEEDFDKGYDSDGEIGPFWGVLKQEGEQLFEEQPLSATEETTTADTALINSIGPSTTNAAEAADSGKKTVQNKNDNNDKDAPNPSAIGAMKIPMLQNELKLRLESAKKNKHILMDRLKKAVNRKVQGYGSLEKANL